MRTLLRLYLLVYNVLLATAVFTIWRSGLIEHLDVGWTIAALVLAVGLGGLLAVLSRS